MSRGSILGPAALPGRLRVVANHRGYRGTCQRSIWLAGAAGQGDRLRVKPALFPLLALLVAGLPLRAASRELWIGTFATGENAGIYRATFDAAAGTLSAPKRIAVADGAGFLATTRDGGLVAATANGPGGAGAVQLWRVGAGDAPWQALATRDSGAGTCHVAISVDGRTLLAANYVGGSVASFRLDAASSRLSPAVSLIAHSGGGPNANRQTSPHPHAFVPLPGGTFAAVPDLGTDSVTVYRIDAATSSLTRHSQVSLPPGSGPRHLAVAATGHTVYVVNELDQSVAVLTWDASAGRLTCGQIISCLAGGGVRDGLFAAEIRLRPDGKFLYCSIRDTAGGGRDVLVVIAVAADGTLGMPRQVPAVVAVPRHFTITPDGRWLLAAGQRSNNIQVFALDDATGLPAPRGAPVACPAPVCLLFRP